MSQEVNTSYPGISVLTWLDQYSDDPVVLYTSGPPGPVGPPGPATIVQTVLNDQSLPVAITGLLFDDQVTLGAYIIYAIKRETNTNLYSETGSFRVLKNTLWLIGGREGSLGDGGLEFDIDPNTGQVTYTSNDVTGVTIDSFLEYKVFPLEA